jgi:LuxR family maltose regulon positive regulatory protein
MRERMIVILMSGGLSNKEIARQLSIGPETVKSHAKSIFFKLTVRSRAQAVYRAATLGLI